MDHPLSTLVGISIPTKDRWSDLEITLQRLQDGGLDQLETVVIDDGSASPMPPSFSLQFPWVRFIRFEISQGVCAQRNRAARLLSRPLILGIDDDSFPYAGDLETAARWLMEHPKVVALAFQIIFQNDPLPENFKARLPFPVRDYIGCGTLIKREIFLSLGGYEENFGFYLEEPEYCLRAIQAGYEIEAYPALVVLHNLTPVARNLAKRAQALIRKETLMALWFYPVSQLTLRVLAGVPAMYVKNPSSRKYLRFLIMGWTGAIYDYFTRKHDKRRFTLEEFKAWKKLPMAVEVVQG